MRSATSDVEVGQPKLETNALLMRGQGISTNKVNDLGYTSTSARPALNSQDEDKKRKFIETIMEKNRELYLEDEMTLSEDSDDDEEWWKEQESSHVKKIKINRNEYEQNIETTTMDVSTREPHPHIERPLDQEPVNHTNNLEVSGSTIVIQFINKSKDENIIHDRGTFNHLINNSPFAEVIEGQGRFKFGSHEYIINIKNNKDLSKLLSIDHLDNKDTG